MVFTGNKIHILGASGAGTTTFGKALASETEILFFDTDDFYWIKTDPPFRTPRPQEERECCRYGPGIVSPEHPLYEDHT